MEVIDPHRFPTSAQEAFDGFGNRSRSFDGSSDYVSIPDINESTTNLTVALWLKTTDVDWVTTHLAHWKTTDNNRAWLISPSTTAETNGKKLMVFISENGAGTNPVKRYYGTTDVSDGTWHHVAFTWDNGTLKLFVDGSEETTTKVLDHAMTTIYNSDGLITVGCTLVNDAPANLGSGGKADVRIYNSTLTATDISDIYNGTNVTTNLVGHWLTDEDNVLDNAGSNDGTNYGSKFSYDNPSPPVEFGSASRIFNGTSDYVDLGNSTDFSFSDGSQDEPFSLCAWIKCDDNGTFRVLSKDNGTGSSFEWLLATDATGLLTIYLIDGAFRGRRYATSPLPENEWLHVASTYDGSGGTNFRLGLKLYVNGVQVDDTDYGTSGVHVAMNPSTNNKVFIGRYATSYPDGKIADARIYDAELSSTDIASLYNGTDVQTNLIGHWLTDNDDVDDKAGSNDGTNYGSTYSYDNPPMDLIPSRQASRSFNSSSNYVDLGNDTSLDLTSMLAISFWVKPDTSHNGAILSKWITGGGGDNNSYSVYLGQDQGNDKISFLLQPSLGVGGGTRVRCDGSISLSTSEWSHVACVADGSTAKLYVNGVLDTSVSFTDTIKVTTNKLFIGKLRDQDTVYLFDGKIADVRLYDTDLSSTEVLDIYNGTTDRTNLIGQWLTNSNDVLDHAGTNDGTNFGSTYSSDSPS